MEGGNQRRPSGDPQGTPPSKDAIEGNGSQHRPAPRPTHSPTGSSVGKDPGEAVESVSLTSDLQGGDGGFPRPRYLEGGPAALDPSSEGALDLSAIEAILRSPIDSQSHEPTGSHEQPSAEPGRWARAHSDSSGHPGHSGSAHRTPSTGDSARRTALLGQALPTHGKPLDPQDPRPTNAGWLSARAFQRFKRSTGFPPRTAFLQSPALGTRPPRRGEVPPAQAAPGHSAPLSEGPDHGSNGATPNLLDLDPTQPLLTEEEINAFFSAPTLAPEPDLEPALAEPEVEDRTAPEESTAPPRPTWLKNQVADLADLVQALDLQARAHHAHVGLEDELARLRQFTRTVGFVASPPPRGNQEFNVGTLTEEALGALAGATPNAPRILFRTRGSRSGTVADKSLVVAALDALLQTAVACAGSGDVVRITVEGRPEEPTVVDVEFPPGPLSERHPDDILAPYGLRKILPGIGPNALAAAGAIAVGQGGDLTLQRDEEGLLTFTLELPGHD